MHHNTYSRINITQIILRITRHISHSKGTRARSFDAQTFVMREKVASRIVEVRGRKLRVGDDAGAGDVDVGEDVGAVGEEDVGCCWGWG